MEPLEPPSCWEAMRCRLQCCFPVSECVAGAPGASGVVLSQWRRNRARKGNRLTTDDQGWLWVVFAPQLTETTVEEPLRTGSAAVATSGVSGHVDSLAGGAQLAVVCVNSVQRLVCRCAQQSEKKLEPLCGRLGHQGASAEDGAHPLLRRMIACPPPTNKPTGPGQRSLPSPCTVCLGQRRGSAGWLQQQALTTPHRM